MGFINYNGPKEDHYTDVLEFARSQQEEEQRRIATMKAAQCVSDFTGKKQYSELEASELLKLIIVRYRQLTSLKEELQETAFIHATIDEDRLWNDFSLWIIEEHLNLFDIPFEARNRYLQTFYSRVFKVDGGPPLEEHNKFLSENGEYKSYFSGCFGLAKEKYYWKWLRDSGDNASKKDAQFNSFVDLYFDLSVLFTYYLFLSFVPFTQDWIHALEDERNKVDSLKSRKSEARFKITDIAKLTNPVYRKAIEIPPLATKPSLLKKKLAGLEALLETQTIPDYVQACRLLISCKLPDKMHALYGDLIERLCVLDDTVEKFKDYYQADLYQFYDYYIPETIRITSTFLEYVDAQVGIKIIQEAEKEVMLAGDTLLLAVNEKIDEIYKFAAIDIKARAKALDAIMNQDGYVDSAYKIN